MLYCYNLQECGFISQTMIKFYETMSIYLSCFFQFIQVYLAQTIFKLLMVTLVVSYTIPLLSSFSFTHTCHPEAQALVGFSTFECLHVLSSLIRKLLVAYLTLLVLYGLLNFYTLSWILHRSVHSYTRMHVLVQLKYLKTIF